MPSKDFALPLDANSKQSGDITVETLAAAEVPATFQLSKVTSGSANQLNLQTGKDDVHVDHIFTATVNGDIGETTLTAVQLKTVYDDAQGGDWDYVRAIWIFGSVDAGGASNMTEIQSGKTYNYHGWPPSN
ncbi:hypothetical protein EHM69_10705 [candidate division KSB1 bacterium]|nr:MAG: hypothetical protein EHM69_10705 [candidate division KSB1 bacterium]